MTVLDWTNFIVRRMAILVGLLIVISFLIFALLYASPGSVVQIMLGTQPHTAAEVRYLTDEYHLNRSFMEQYWIWASHAVRFQFGRSTQTRLPVSAELESRLPTTLFLAAYAYALMLILGIGGGVAAALRSRRAVDRSIVGASVVALSTPAFVGGLILIYLFGVVVRWFPVAGTGSGFFNEFWHLTLPAIALALTGTAYLVKHTRAATLGVLDQDYVTFGRARGLSRRRVLAAYAFRNALVPVVTISGVLLSYVITGAVLVEQTFSISGVGQLLVQSATAKDLPMIQGVALFIAAVIMVANLAADICVVAIDPRVRFSRTVR